MSGVTGDDSSASLALFGIKYSIRLLSVVFKSLGGCTFCFLDGNWLTLLSGLDGGVGRVGRESSKYSPGRVAWYMLSSRETRIGQDGRASG